MSVMEADTVAAENVVRAPSRFGLTPLQQFARAGLDLKIGDFRQMCEELDLEWTTKGQHQTANDVADMLFAWMEKTLGQDER